MNTSNKMTFRERLWNRDPHCYWCGHLTRLVVLNGGKVPPDGATVDHVRCRYAPTRAERDGQWRKGICVLACSKCNNLRAKHEEAFFRELDPAAFIARGNGTPAKPSLIQAQTALCNAVLAYLKSHALAEDSYGREVRKRADFVRAEYAAKAAAANTGGTDH